MSWIQTEASALTMTERPHVGVEKSETIMKPYASTTAGKRKG